MNGPVGVRDRVVGRRALLVGAAAGTVLIASGCGSAAGNHSQALRDPFTLGVASGEPTADGVVLWTRLAPRPLAEDGLGGMPARAVEVDWELATDEQFRQIE